MCPAHLQDRHFCSPIVDAEGDAKRQKEEAMAKEIEKVKQEYEEKQKRKKEKAKESSKDEKDKDKDNSKDKDKDKVDSDSKANDEKERDEKVCGDFSIDDDMHVLIVFLGRLNRLKMALTRRRTMGLGSLRYISMFLWNSIEALLLIRYRTFYQMRIDRLRGIERAKRNQERMKNPSLFPSVPNREL